MLNGLRRGIAHPQRGLVSPAQFVRIAEESGSIAAIGRWVLHEAFRRSRARRTAGLPPIRMAVNISAVESRDKALAESVGGILEEHGLLRCDLELELTGTLWMRDSNSIAVALQSLSELGVRIALDDFGVGYASSSHLKHFPIDALKIDRSSAHNLLADADDASIVSAKIAMGKALQIRVNAQGVETREQLAPLRRQGCAAKLEFIHNLPRVAWNYSRTTWRFGSIIEVFMKFIPSVSEGLLGATVPADRYALTPPVRRSKMQISRRRLYRKP